MTFQPGRSGNPTGGRKDKPFRDALMVVLNEAEGDKKKLRLVAEQLVTKATGGDVSAAKEIADRVDGKVPQGLIGGDDGDPPIQITRVEIVAAVSDDSTN